MAAPMGTEKSLLWSIVLSFYSIILLYYPSSAMLNDAPVIKAIRESENVRLNAQKLTQINNHFVDQDLTAVKNQVSRSRHDSVYQGVNHYESFYCDSPTFQFVNDDIIKQMQHFLQNDTSLESLYEVSEWSRTCH